MLEQRRHGYVNIPGSASLKTRKKTAAPEIAEVEAMEVATPFAREIRGELLAHVMVRVSFVAFPKDVFERVLPLQAPLEQVLYLHLMQLCLAKERNFCRISRKTLGERCQLSDRRLGAALAGLVDKDHIRLVDRNREGTLYRICFPHEIFGEPAPESVHIHSLKSASSREAKPPRETRKTEPVEVLAQTAKPSADTTAAESQRVDDVDNKRTVATSAPLVSFAEAMRASTHDVPTSEAPVGKGQNPSKLRSERTASASTQALLGTPISTGPQGSPLAQLENNSRSERLEPVAREPLPRPSPVPHLTTSSPEEPRPAPAKNDSPGGIAVWFQEQFGAGNGRSKTQLIEAIFDRLEAGKPFFVIRQELTFFGEQKPGRPISELRAFIEASQA